jgi:hypothetical protein
MLVENMRLAYPGDPKSASTVDPATLALSGARAVC